MPGLRSKGEQAAEPCAGHRKSLRSHKGDDSRSSTKRGKRAHMLALADLAGRAKLDELAQVYVNICIFKSIVIICVEVLTDCAGAQACTVANRRLRLSLTVVH